MIQPVLKERKKKAYPPRKWTFLECNTVSPLAGTKPRLAGPLVHVISAKSMVPSRPLLNSWDIHTCPDCFTQGRLSLSLPAHCWEHQPEGHSQSGFLQSCAEPEAILPIVNRLAEAIWTGHILTMSKDGAKLALCVLYPSRESPLGLRGRSGIRKHKSKYQMNYNNTMRREQCSGENAGFCPLLSPAKQPCHKSCRSPRRVPSHRHTCRMLFLSLCTTLDWKWPKCPPTKTEF